MAINARSIKGAPNAFEYSNLISVAFGGTEQVTDALLATTNSTGMTFTIDRMTAPDCTFKMQMTCATTEEVNNGVISGTQTPIPWHDWDVPNMDAGTHYLDQDQFDWWIPIPSAVRMVTKNAHVSTNQNIYWAVRGQ
jgi:hypothetical protein